MTEDMIEVVDGRRAQRRFNTGSWVVPAIGISYIVSAVVYVLLAFAQPTDGWLYQSNPAAEQIAVENQAGRASPLHVGDKLLAIAGIAVNTGVLQSKAPPPGWRVGGLARYSIERAGHVMQLDVPLVARPGSALLRFVVGGGESNAFLSSLLCLLIGFGVFWLRPRETAARLLLLTLVFFMTNISIVADSNPARMFYPPALFAYYTITGYLWPLMFAMITHLALVFPVRKWPLTRYPRVALITLYGLGLVGSATAPLIHNQAVYTGATFLMMGLMLIALIGATIHNLRTVQIPTVRAQIRWVAFGLGVSFGGAVLAVVLVSVAWVPPTFSALFGWVWSRVLLLLLPISLGIAITRYRLWDIDVLIRRTLVYSVLTLTLGLVYLGCILVSRTLVAPLTGGSELAIVISTLAIAALFLPLRRRIQRIIDKRFYRRKYDAAKVLAAFGVTARDETNLDALTNEMLRVVDTTMQPEFVGLWLRDTQSHRTQERPHEESPQPQL
jgi:hypothetical protein